MQAWVGTVSPRRHPGHQGPRGGDSSLLPHLAFSPPRSQSQEFSDRWETPEGGIVHHKGQLTTVPTVPMAAIP